MKNKRNILWTIHKESYFHPLNDITNGHTTNTLSDINVDKNKEKHESLKFGYFTWKPDWLQSCNNPRMLLAAVSWFTFIQGKIKLFKLCKQI